MRLLALSAATLIAAGTLLVAVPPTSAQPGFCPASYTNAQGETSALGGRIQSWDPRRELDGFTPEHQLWSAKCAYGDDSYFLVWWIGPDYREVVDGALVPWPKEFCGAGSGVDTNVHMSPIRMVRVDSPTGDGAFGAALAAKVGTDAFPCASLRLGQCVGVSDAALMQSRFDANLARSSTDMVTTHCRYGDPGIFWDFRVDLVEPGGTEVHPACTETGGPPDSQLWSADRQASVTLSYAEPLQGPTLAIAQALLARAETLADTCPGKSPGRAETAEVRGRVFVEGPDDTWLDLRRAQVRVLLEWSDGKAVLETYTGEDGRYKASHKFSNGIPSSLRYSPQVSLRDRDGVIEIRSEVAFAGDVVTAKLAPRKFSEEAVENIAHASIILAGSRTFDPARIEANGLESRLQDFDPRIAQDAANVYVHALTAADYARDTLGLAMDQDLPVEYRIHGLAPQEAPVHYDASDSSVRMVSTETQSSFLRPGVSFTVRHEFGHHVHSDSAVSGDNHLPQGLQGDKAHEGYGNQDSTDSFTEGLATFFAVLTTSGSLYDLHGTIVDLEPNHVHSRTEILELSPGLQMVGAPELEEEFRVAALLWDLTDEGAEPGDAVAVAPADLWTFMAPAYNVHTLYQALQGKVGTAQTTSGGTVLDALFVAHGFFWDRDGDRAWSASDPVGYSDSHRDRYPSTHPSPREDVPPLTGNAIQVRAPDAGGPPDTYLLWFSYDESYYDGFGFFAEADDGLLGLYVPAAARSVSIHPVVPGHSVQPLVVTAQDFAAGWAQAAAAGSTAFQTWTPVLGEPAVGPPRDFRAKPAGLTVDLSWKVPDGAREVIVVAGTEASPDTPVRGRLVYQGPGTSVTDEVPLEEAATHYAAFAVGEDGSYSRPATAKATASLAGPQERSGIPFPGLLGVLAVLALAGLFARRG